MISVLISRQETHSQNSASVMASKTSSSRKYKYVMGTASPVRWVVRFPGKEWQKETSFISKLPGFNKHQLGPHIMSQEIFLGEQVPHSSSPPCFVYLPILLQNWCKRSGNEGGRMQFQAITDLTIHERNKISCLDCEALRLDMNLQWHLWEQHTRLCQALREKKLDSWCLSRLSHFLSLRLQWEIGGYHKSWT